MSEVSFSWTFRGHSHVRIAQQRNQTPGCDEAPGDPLRELVLTNLYEAVLLLWG
jgi:hypothetical protein